MRSRRSFGFILLTWVALAMPSQAPAQTSVTSNATLSADCRSIAKLSVSPATIAFPDANPGLVPQVPSAAGALNIVAKARSTKGSQVLLTVQATDDLRSGVNVIPAPTITWTVSGP